MYEIPCGDCQQVYVGQTDRNFECRLKEHHRAFKNIDEIRSAVAEIDMCHHHHTRLLLESWHITSKKNREWGPLSILYDSLHGR